MCRACQAGRDTQTERGNADAGNPDGPGSVSAAVVVAGVKRRSSIRNFSEHSYGFRPGRSAQDAVRAAQRYAQGGKEWVVDIDITKFFDHVNHDILMGRIAEVIRDKRVLRLIGKYLRRGAMVDGLVEASEEGTPQGGPLSPLLANILSG